MLNNAEMHGGVVEGETNLKLNGIPCKHKFGLLIIILEKNKHNRVRNYNLKEIIFTQINSGGNGSGT
jgi:hypothetical protein